MSQRKEFHITYKTLADCYGNRFTSGERAEFLEHLDSDCPLCDELISRPPGKYQLEEEELEAIFREIKKEITPAEGREVAPTEGFERGEKELALESREEIGKGSPRSIWAELKIWLRPAFGLGFSAALLAILWLAGGDERAPLQTGGPAKGEEKYWGYKNNCRGAYLLIEVHRPHSGQKGRVQKLAFKPGEDYYIGDVMLFRFLVVRKGYVYLLREDAEGRLEQLYPFGGDTPKSFEAGETYQLERNGVRMGYFLEPNLVGYQKLWLVHSDRPVEFPNHIKFLTPKHRELFKCAEQMDFFVKPKPN